MREIGVDVVQKPRPKQRARAHYFRKAFSASHGKLHGFLKWFAINHLWNGPFSSECWYEQSIYIPYDAYEALYDGRKLSNVGLGRVLNDKVPYYPERKVPLPMGNEGIIRTVDVYGGGTAVECGETDLGDLLLPLVAHAVARVLWIPFPKEHDKNDDWFQPDPSIHFAFDGTWSYPKRCDALLIELRPPSPTEIRRIIRAALREASRSEKANITQR